MGPTTASFMAQKFTAEAMIRRLVRSLVISFTPIPDKVYKKQSQEFLWAK
tara:strand:- start:566 stop:715 length:150 start_codon:yes stop_codon:yes gene_type:complete